MRPADVRGGGGEPSGAARDPDEAGYDAACGEALRRKGTKRCGERPEGARRKRTGKEPAEATGDRSGGAEQT